MESNVRFSVLAVLLIAVPSSCHSVFQDGWLALPVNHPAPSVDVVLTVTYDKDQMTCSVEAYDGQNTSRKICTAQNVAMGTPFQVPDVSPCVWFTCELTALGLYTFDLDRNRTGCQYGAACLDGPPVEEKDQQFTCLKDFNRIWTENDTMTYRLRLGFSATPDYIITAVKNSGRVPSFEVDLHFDNKNQTCTVEGKTVKFGDKVEVMMHNNFYCITFLCYDGNILPEKINCIGPGEVCADVASRDCAQFQCVTTTDTIEMGNHVLTIFLASWLPLNPPKGCMTHSGGKECRRPGEQWRAEETPRGLPLLCACHAETLTVACEHMPTTPTTTKPPRSTTSKLLTTLKMGTTEMQTTLTAFFTTSTIWLESTPDYH